MTSITVSEAARNLSDLLNRVHDRGESFPIVRGNEEVARLVPPEEQPELAPGELLRRLSRAARPDSDFAADLEEIQASQPALPPGPGV